MEIDLDVYFWMLDRGILEDDSRNKIFTGDNYCRLFREHGKKVLNGVYIAQIMLMLKKTLIRQHDGPISVDPGISNLKDNITEIAKSHNWNLLSKELPKFGIKLRENKKKIIQSEDEAPVRTVLYQLYCFDNPEKNINNLYLANNHVEYEEEKHISDSLLDMNEDLNTAEVQQESPAKNHSQNNGTVNIDKIDPQGDPTECQNVLEFFLTTISQAMDLSPKQACGLLSNNNKYLVHVCVRGVKGDFCKISQWYQILYQSCRHLAGLIDEEEEQGTISLSLKMISSGLLSPDYDIVSWCLRVLSKLASELDIRKILSGAYEWFVEQEGGLSLVIYAINKHSDITENVASVIFQFCKYNMLEVFNLHLKNLTIDQAQYMSLVTDIYSSVSDQFSSITPEVLDFWIDTAIQQAEADKENAVPEKTSALSFLSEVWISQPDKIQEQEELAELILKLLNKGSRDKSKNLKICCFTILFKLLETFTSEKNDFAPKIYKSLTFLFVENHQDVDIRQYMFKNFADIFENIENIPIAILLESLIKQIKISGNMTYQFNVFDFEFFQAIAKHPRLHLKLAIDFVDLLGKIICNDITFSSSASESFMIILKRYHDHETMQHYMSKFTHLAMRFLVNYEKQKKALSKTHQVENDKLKSGRGNSVKQISNPEDQKMKWIQKTLYIHLFKTVVEKIGSPHLNSIFKDEIIKTYLTIQKYKLKSDTYKEYLVLVKLFGEPDKLVAEYKAANKNNSPQREENDIVSIKSQKAHNSVRKNMPKDKDSNAKQELNHISLSVNHKSSKLSPSKMKSMRNIRKVREPGSDKDLSVLSEMPMDNPLKANHEKLMYQPDLMLAPGEDKIKLGKKLTKNEQRVIKEIEKVKMRRQQKLENEMFKEERKQKQQEKLRNQIKQELERRKVEHGVVSNKKKTFKKSNIIDNFTDKESVPKIIPDIELYDFALEEEKDKSDVHNFLKTYNKLLIFIFKTYANKGYSTKNNSSFDAMHNRLEVMSLADYIIMLKKNSVIPDLIQKDEASLILRLVNAHISGDKREGRTITQKNFPHLFLQVAMFAFSRDPINLSQRPPIESPKALLKMFEKAALERGESIRLFEEPEHTILADNDMIKELNTILTKNPDHPMPEGFKKIKMKEYKSVYKIPDYVPIEEPKKIALEIIDEMLSKQFGFHIFEPISKPQVSYKAKPILEHMMKNPIIKKDVPYILEKAGLPPRGRKNGNLEPIPSQPYRGEKSLGTNRRKRTKSKTRNVNQSLPAHRSIGPHTDIEKVAKRKRIYNDVTPEIGLALRLEVVKYPTHSRAMVQEVAETLEEILRAASKGLAVLPPRKKYGLHSHMNKAQQLKSQRLENERKMRENKDK